MTDANIETALDYKVPTGTVDVSALANSSTTDLDFSDQPLYNVYVGGAGSIWLKRIRDTEWVEYACLQGAQIFGAIVAIANTGSQRMTATKVVGELP